MDQDVLSDDAIYHIIPEIPEEAKAKKKACTFPRDQEHLGEINSRRVASCPGSPALSFSGAEGPPNIRAPSPPKLTEHPDESKKKNGSNSGKGLPLENFYYSLRKVAILSKRKSGLWWRRKGSQKSDDLECPSSRRSSDVSVAPESPQETSKSPSRVTNGFSIGNCSLDNTSDATTCEDEAGDCTYIKVCGGVSYVKPKPEEKKPKTLQAVDSLDTTGSLECLVSEWQKKSRWLSRNQKRKGSKYRGDNSYDIVIVYSSSDADLWASYFQSHLPRTLSSPPSTTFPRVRKVTVEELCAHANQSSVISRLVKDSKLQMLLISPSLVSYLKEHSKTFDLGKVLKPRKVLALMLKVTSQEIFSDSVIMSSLYSFGDWTRLDVKGNDNQFVREVEKEALSIIVQSEAYSDFQYSKAFSIFPRKVTSQHSKVYIHLVTPMHDQSTYSISLHSSNGSEEELPSSQDDIKNPYTIRFNVPDKYISKVSYQMISVHLTVDDTKLGFKELKCEGALEVIRSAFENAENAIDLMEEALGYSGSRHQSLDSLLASKLQKNIVFHQLLDDDLNDPVETETVDMPTWLHFGAKYGLEKFCDTLLKLPGYNKLLSLKDVRGNTPHLIAYKNKHVEMASALEEQVVKPAAGTRKSYSPRIEVPDMDYVEIMGTEEETEFGSYRPFAHSEEYLTMERVSVKPESVEEIVEHNEDAEDNGYISLKNDHHDENGSNDEDDQNEGIYLMPNDLPTNFVYKHYRNEQRRQAS